jgi:hypothetical protein
LQLTDSGAAALRSEDETAISTLITQAHASQQQQQQQDSAPELSQEFAASSTRAKKRKNSTASHNKQNAVPMEDAEVIDLTANRAAAGSHALGAALTTPVAPLVYSSFPSMLEILRLPGTLLICVRMRRLPPTTSRDSSIEVVATAAWPPDVFRGAQQQEDITLQQQQLKAAPQPPAESVRT